MKNSFFGMFLLFLLFIACNSKTDQKSKTNSGEVTQAEIELLHQAQGIFKALPIYAENSLNPITPEKVALGKLLYFDTRLSKNGNNSCNTCHNLSTFGVDNLPTSKGDAGKFGERNSPTVLNAALHTSQFWDGRAHDVEEQAGLPILNPIEMAIPSKEFLVKRLKAINKYTELFKAAFPSHKDPLTYVNLEKSIGAFERTLITHAPFDDYLNNNHSAITTDQKSGLKTFITTGCIACHSGVALGGTSFQKFGIFGDYRTFTHSKTNDQGRKAITKMDIDKDFFKVPSLRNIEKTGPYFHDGSISDLKQAVSIMAKTELNKDLTEAEVYAIVIFLNSLTGIVPNDVKIPPRNLVTR